MNKHNWLYLFLTPLVFPVSLLFIKQFGQPVCPDTLNISFGLNPGRGGDETIYARLSRKIKSCPKTKLFIVQFTNRYWQPWPKNSHLGPGDWLDYTTTLSYDRKKKKIDIHSKGSCGPFDCQYQEWAQVTDKVIERAANNKTPGHINLSPYGAKDMHL